MKQGEKKVKNLTINVPAHLQSPTFSNIAQVHATDREVILDFAFVQPGLSQGVIVAKIALTPEHAKSLNAVLSGVLQKHYEKKKEKKSQSK
jgi:hypothetical protein